MNRQPIATIGAILRITPMDGLQVDLEPDSEGVFINDYSPFEFQVEGRLEDGQIFYGLFGPVVSGPRIYNRLDLRGLTCNIILRDDGADWRIENEGTARFIIGPSTVERDHRYDFRHPFGTRMNCTPVVSSLGTIEVIQTDDH